MSDDVAPPPLPTVPLVPEGVRSAARQGKLVIFVGAGVSRLHKGPSWEELAEKLLGQLNEKNYISFAEWQQLKQLDPRKKISIASDIFEVNGLKPDFPTIFHPGSEGISLLKVYQDLYSIGTPFVTTNYDQHLDRCAELPSIKSSLEGLEGIEEPTAQKQREAVKLTPAGRVFFRKEDLTIEKLTRPGDVMHLHGSFRDPNTLVLTTRDYLEHYQDPVVQTFLQELFARHTVLFIGYGLEEEEILEHIFRKRDSNSGGRHYRLFHRFSYEEGLYKHLSQYYSNHCCVELVQFSIDDHGHQQLADVISEWSRQLSLEAQEAGFLEKIKIIDEALSG